MDAATAERSRPVWECEKFFHRQNEVLHFISIDINSKTQKLLDL